MKKLNHNGGYVGLVTLLIIITILAFFITKSLSSSYGKTPGPNAQGITPIEQAKEAKMQLEKSGTQINQYINLRPKIILPGDPVFITLESPPVSILWDKKVIPFFLYEGKYRALFPIDFNEKVLEHTLTVKFKNETATSTIKITPRPKVEKPLGIPEKLGGDTPQAAESLVNNLAAENKILNTVKSEPAALWTEAFQYPVKNIFVTDEYGYSRATVDQTIPHKGTDFRAQVGTEVRAMNRGIVRIARPFVVYGNAVVIDHGLGVQTLYMHMSKLLVKEGDMVEKGQLIGLSGDTGYVEAAHLHISVKINAVSIDPMTFMKFFLL